MKAYLQKQDDPCIGHGVCQSQDATAHNGVAQVEDRHAKRGFTLKLESMETGNVTYLECMKAYRSQVSTYISETWRLFVIHA